MTIRTKEFKINEERKLEMLCRFANVKYTIIMEILKVLKIQMLLW